MSQAADFPLRWPLWAGDPRYRLIVLRRFPYQIFYEVGEGLIEVVAVAHTRRDPGYWLGRGRRTM